MYLNFESQEKQYVMIRCRFSQLHLLVDLWSNNLNNVLISRDKSQKSTIARPNLAIKHTHPYNLYLVFRNLTKFIYLRKNQTTTQISWKSSTLILYLHSKRNWHAKKRLSMLFEISMYLLTLNMYQSLKPNWISRIVVISNPHIDIHKWLICKWLK